MTRRKGIEILAAAYYSKFCGIAVCRHGVVGSLCVCLSWKNLRDIFLFWKNASVFHRKETEDGEQDKIKMLGCFTGDIFKNDQFPEHEFMNYFRSCPANERIPADIYKKKIVGVDNNFKQEHLSDYTCDTSSDIQLFVYILTEALEKIYTPQQGPCDNVIDANIPTADLVEIIMAALSNGDVENIKDKIDRMPKFKEKLTKEDGTGIEDLKIKLRTFIDNVKNPSDKVKQRCREAFDMFFDYFDANKQWIAE